MKTGNLKAVLFDMDGVLYDSMKNHASAWTKVMLRHGFQITEQEAYMHEGRTGDSTIDLISKREGKIIGAEERKRIYAEKTVEFAACPPVVPMAYSVKLLRKVTGNGLMVMLVTGSGQPSLLEQINTDFPEFFTRETMITAFDYVRGKPNPDPYLMALERGKILHNEAIVIENAPLGIQSAKAAGIYTVAANTGPLPDAVLRNAGADLIFPSIKAVYDHWEKILERKSGS
ncbi:MAG: HAD hydrolase-like protein [Tannerella sp.]|jgi:beta-phosphoglucomutase-like phosphatase (HAD superfamily)|nr:HAD hydrolase-like protein [Tannerella sp.]